MNPIDFLNNVLAHQDLEPAGAVEFRDEVVVRHRPTRLAWALPVSEVLAHPWEELEAVLTGKREPHLMMHLSRIVGYYSRVDNWNRSKLAELRDRQKGAALGGYGVGEGMNIRRSEVPPELVETLAASGAEMTCDLSKKGSA